MRALLAAWTLCLAQTALAEQYNGRVMVGVYQSKEEFVEPSAGTYSNDHSRILGSLYLEVGRLGPWNNEFVLDVRDRYDQFGSPDQGNVRLVPSNEPRLRQLAVRKPLENSKLYWALGRMTVLNASVLGNDGADIAYALSSKMRLGLFGGLHPEHRDGKTVAIAEEAPQAGIYGVYEEKGRIFTRHLHVATSLVTRQGRLREEPQEQEAVDEAAEDEATEEAQEENKEPDELFWYTNVVYQPSARRRITYIGHIALDSGLVARNVWASWQEYLSSRLRLTGSVFRLDLTEYDRQRDIRDRLPASQYTLGKLQSRYFFTSRYFAQIDASHGTRSFDGATRSEGIASFGATRLLSGQMSATLAAGYRANFVSDDVLLKAGATAYLDGWEISFTQQMISETHESGEKLTAHISDVFIGGLLGKDVYLAGGVEYATDEKVTITSGLVTFGYRFSNAQMTPVRESAPPASRL